MNKLVLVLIILLICLVMSYPQERLDYKSAEERYPLKVVPSSSASLYSGVLSEAIDYGDFVELTFVDGTTYHVFGEFQRSAIYQVGVKYRILTMDEEVTRIEDAMYGGTWLPVRMLP